MYSKALEQIGQNSSGFVMDRHAKQIKYLTGEIGAADRKLEAEAAVSGDARLLASMTKVSLYAAVSMGMSSGVRGEKLELPASTCVAGHLAQSGLFVKADVVHKD